MIADTINLSIAKALKAKDEIKLSTLRLLSSALNYEFIAKQHVLTEEEELSVVRREAKKRKEAIEAYEKAGASDRAEKEKKEMAVLEEYLIRNDKG
ncbi:GatB/YqeY domain-containing protein [Candidatus Woesebacteria bacterium]|nr:GatB/YqeY domain-containing protein [Candidatus Woesebacteria bacterium]